MKCYILEDDQLRLQILQNHHDTTLAGHPKMAKIFDLLDRLYYWKDMQKQVDHSLQNCHNCRWSQTSRHATFRVLRPLPVPEQPWEDISTNFVVGQPDGEEFDTIWVVVDWHSKRRHCIHCPTTIHGVGLAQFFLREVL